MRGDHGRRVRRHPEPTHLQTTALLGLGVWYLIVLGVVAILFALLLPRGIWGTIEGRFGIQLMPVGYRVKGLLKREGFGGSAAESGGAPLPADIEE